MIEDQRLDSCETKLSDAHAKIERLEGNLQNITIEKTTLEGSLKRICDKIDNLNSKINTLQEDLKEYKKENKTNMENIGNKIESFRDCLTKEKLANQKNSIVIATITPILILAIAFFLGLK